MIVNDSELHVYAVSSCNELLWYGIMEMCKAEAKIVDWIKGEVAEFMVMYVDP